MTRKILNALGFLVGLVAIGFVVLRLRTYAAQIDLARLSAAVWAQLLGLVVISGAANTLLGIAWRHLLAHVGVDASPRWAIRIHGVSQIGRYVPGNILQFAGRQALGMAAGLPAGPLARSVVWELGLLVSLGGALALSVLPLRFAAVPPVVPTLLALAVLLPVLWRLFGPSVARAAFWQLAFFIVYSTTFVATVELVQGHTFAWSVAPTVAAAFALAWLIGLVTPGAPAGGGIREAVLLFLLSDRIQPADLLLAVVIGRAVNVLGDVLFFLFASALRAPEPPHVRA